MARGGEYRGSPRLRSLFGGVDRYAVPNDAFGFCCGRAPDPKIETLKSAMGGKRTLAPLLACSSHQSPLANYHRAEIRRHYKRPNDSQDVPCGASAFGQAEQTAKEKHRCGKYATAGQ